MTNRNSPKQYKHQPAAQPPKKSCKLSAWAMAVLVVSGIALYMTFSTRSDNQAQIGDLIASTVIASPIQGQDFRIPISEVSDGRAKFYDYKLANNKTIRLFVIKSSDGVVRAALDACIICYRFHLGYHQEGGDMVCKKCKKHFRSIDVNVKSGACNPIPLTRSIEGNTLLIKAGDLKPGAIYF